MTSDQQFENNDLTMKAVKQHILEPRHIIDLDAERLQKFAETYRI
jgi:hypothetical protein